MSWQSETLGGGQAEAGLLYSAPPVQRREGDVAAGKVYKGCHRQIPWQEPRMTAQMLLECILSCVVKSASLVSSLLRVLLPVATCFNLLQLVLVLCHIKPGCKLHLQAAPNFSFTFLSVLRRFIIQPIYVCSDGTTTPKYQY
jgi:hypothetical protein